jgi:hypothetical protein
MTKCTVFSACSYKPVSVLTINIVSYVGLSQYININKNKKQMYIIYFRALLLSLNPLIPSSKAVRL